MATDLPFPHTSHSSPPSLRPLTSSQPLQDPSSAPQSKAGILHFPAPFVVGPKLANKCPGGKLPLHPLQGREQEGPYLSPSLSMIPVPHSLWNFIMFPGSTEVWQLRTDLAGRRRARLTCRSLPALRVSPQSAAAEYRGPGTEAL